MERQTAIGNWRPLPESNGANIKCRSKVGVKLRNLAQVPQGRRKLSTQVIYRGLNKYEYCSLGFFTIGML